MLSRCSSWAPNVPNEFLGLQKKGNPYGRAWPRTAGQKSAVIVRSSRCSSNTGVDCLQ